MKIILTGSTGFVGGHLLKHFTQIGWSVQTIGRGDDLTSMKNKMLEFKPDVVCHLASYFVAEHQESDIEKLIQSNLLFGNLLAEAMIKTGVKKLINTGSTWQNWEGQKHIPTSLYAATKNAFESLLQYYISAENLNVINLCLSDTYGPQDPRAKLIPKLIDMTRNGGELSVSPGNQVLDFTHIDDVCSAFEVACRKISNNTSEKGFSETYSITSGERLSLVQLVSLMESISGKKINVHFGARPYRRREVMTPQDLSPRLTQWTPQHKLEKGLKELLNES